MSRSAVFRPMPGQPRQLGGQIVDRRHSRSERQLERQVHAAGELAHLVLARARCAFFCASVTATSTRSSSISTSAGFTTLGSILTRLNVALARRPRPSPCRRRPSRSRSTVCFFLDLLELALHLLRLLQDLHEICMRTARKSRCGRSACALRVSRRVEIERVDRRSIEPRAPRSSVVDRVVARATGSLLAKQCCRCAHSPSRASTACSSPALRVVESCAVVLALRTGSACSTQRDASFATRGAAARPGLLGESRQFAVAHSRDSARSTLAADR